MKRSFVFIVVILTAVCASQYFFGNRNTHAQSSNPCDSVSGKGETISLAGAKTQQVGVTTPEAAVDKNNNTSALIQPPAGSMAYLVVFLPKRLNVTKITLTIKPESATQNILNQYLVGAGNGSTSTIIKRESFYKSPFDYCYIQNLPNANSKVNTNTFVYNAVNTNNKPAPADFIYLYNVGDISLAVSEIQVEGFDPAAPARLKGTASLERYSDLKLDGVSIFNDANNELLGKTNDNGEYSKDNLKSGDSITVRAEREGFKNLKKQLSLKPGDNTLDFALKLEDENSITGHVTVDGKPESMFVILLKDGQRLKVAVSSITDGAYTFTGMPSGTYQIQVKDNVSDAVGLKTSPADIRMTIQKPYGEKLNQDILLFEVPAGKYELRVSAQENSLNFESIHSSEGVELKGARVELTPINIPSQSKRLGVTPIRFERLTPGSYLVSASKDGFQSKSMRVTISHPGLSFATFYLSGKNTRCENSPRTNVKEFWLCGSEAIAMKNDEKLTVIDNTIGQFRQSFKYKNLPLEVVVIASNSTNAAFVYGLDVENSKGLCPVPLTGDANAPKLGEHIEITTGSLKLRNSSQVTNAIMHELGHGKSYRDTGCKGKRSAQSDFIDLRTLGMRFGAQFFQQITEGLYRGQISTDGHPEANADETYASLFLICQLHKDEFNSKINSKVIPIKRTLQSMGDIALSGGPAKCSK